MPTESHAGTAALRTALRELVALSTIPAAWVGREPPIIAAGLADVLVGSLHLDFAFVRLCDPDGGAAVEVTRGNAWKAFPEWLQRHLAAVGQCSRTEIIPDVGGGIVFFSSRRLHTSSKRDWSSDVCSSDLPRGRAATVHRCANEAAGPVRAARRG